MASSSWVKKTIAFLSDKLLNSVSDVNREMKNNALAFQKKRYRIVMEIF